MNMFTLNALTLRLINAQRRTLALRCEALEEEVNVHCGGERSAREEVADLRVHGEAAARRHQAELETMTRRYEAGHV